MCVCCILQFALDRKKKAATLPLSGEFYHYASEGPLTYGDMHDNDYYAGSHTWDHLWHDVLKQ